MNVSRALAFYLFYLTRLWGRETRSCDSINTIPIVGPFDVDIDALTFIDDAVSVIRINGCFQRNQSREANNTLTAPTAGGFSVRCCHIHVLKGRQLGNQSQGPAIGVIASRHMHGRLTWLWTFRLLDFRNATFSPLPASYGKEKDFDASLSPKLMAVKCTSAVQQSPNVIRVGSSIASFRCCFLWRDVTWRDGTWSDMVWHNLTWNTRADVHETVRQLKSELSA